MLILSLNVHGLGGKAKQHSLQTLFRFVRPNMILLQETMCSTYPALLLSRSYCLVGNFVPLTPLDSLVGFYQLGTLIRSGAVLLKELMASCSKLLSGEWTSPWMS